MSYILDALRKSEQQRQRGLAPRLFAVQATPRASARTPVSLTYGLIALAMMGAGAAIGWLHPWQHEQVSSAPESAAAEPPESGPLRLMTAPLPASPERTAKPENEQPAQTPSAAKPAPAPALVIANRNMPAITNPPVSTRKLPPKSAAVVKEKAIPVMAALSPEKAATPSGANLAGAASKEAAPEQKVIALGELPTAIQQKIPEMSIPVHSYSSAPKERIVGINDRLLQEGDYLAPGLKVEEITPDGVIFSYKTYLFRHGL